MQGLKEWMLGTAEGQNRLDARDLIAVCLHHIVMMAGPAV